MDEFERLVGSQDVTRVLFEQSEHTPMVTEPEKFVDSIVRFLQRVNQDYYQFLRGKERIYEHVTTSFGNHHLSLVYLYKPKYKEAIPMRLQTSPESFHHYRWLIDKASLRTADVSKDAGLDAMLRYDSKDVVALLCHDALFKGDARIGSAQRAPLITALALLSRNSGNDWVKIQGSARLKQRLKMALDVLPTMEKKIDFEVEARVIINKMEYFVLVYAPIDNKMYGVVRLSLIA